MVVVDSSVWIDFFNGARTRTGDRLKELLAGGETTLVVPDLVLYEVLRGFRDERDYLQARALMQTLDVESTVDPALAVRAATHYRSLRAVGVTVRSAIDVLIAAFCIEHDQALLHRDADFTAFERVRGLRVWRH